MRNLQYLFITNVLALLFLVVSFSSSCSAPAETKPQQLATPKNGEFVDCNYYWSARRRHVCIKDMPVKECEDLFFMPSFQRERNCVCDDAGRKKNQVKGTGYIQYDCE
ncbi:MAG: hypothetical protein H3C43_07200 [Leptonema sp. (in: Bacteria)]|nr:hypothetical protein [Leptonema sp. (in: bacteria)]